MMKNRPKFYSALIILMMLSTACGAFKSPVPTLDFTTPDLTLTAIFSVLVTPDTQTPLPIAMTATNTATIAPPTDTPTVYVSPNPETLAPTYTAAALTEMARYTPTFTPTNTFTPAPTLTPTQPSRSGPTVYASFLSPAPKIDGSLGDWDGDWISASYVVYGKANRSDSADLSSRFKIGWDWNYLYLAVQVNDDIYAQNAKGADLYLGASLEVLLDNNLGGDFNSEGLSPDDYQLGISGTKLSNDTPGEAYLWYPEVSRGGKGKVVIQGRPTDAGYRMEVAIPWSVFGISPLANWRYGFAFGVSDNDNTSSNEQHSMVSNVQDRKLTNPKTWGNLVLTP